MPSGVASISHSGRVRISPLRVPPELLVEIIDEAANGSASLQLPHRELWTAVKCCELLEPYPSQRLSDYLLVSFLWYRTIIGTPRLWTRIRVDTKLDTSPVLLVERELRALIYCLARSRELSLDIAIAGHSGRHHDIIKPTLLGSCKRWHTLTVFATAHQEVFKDYVSMPQLEVLHLPKGLQSPFQMSAPALRTILLQGDEHGDECALHTLQKSLAQYPQVTSLICAGIEISPDVDEIHPDVMESELSKFQALPNLVELDLIHCRHVDYWSGEVDTALHVTLLRASPALKCLRFYITSGQRFGPYWRTLQSPIKHLEILPETLEDGVKSVQNLVTFLTSFPMVETISWGGCWRDQTVPPLTSVNLLLRALSRGSSQHETLAPMLRHMEFEEVEIDREHLYSFCRERDGQFKSDKRIGGIRSHFTITTHEGCIYKADDDTIKPFPCVDTMIWMDLKKMILIC